MIEAHALTRRFGTFTAVTQLSLSVPAGSVVALLWPGKAAISSTGTHSDDPAAHSRCILLWRRAGKRDLLAGAHISSSAELLFPYTGLPLVWAHSPLIPGIDLGTVGIRCCDRCYLCCRCTAHSAERCHLAT